MFQGPVHHSEGWAPGMNRCSSSFGTIPRKQNKSFLLLIVLDKHLIRQLKNVAMFTMQTLQVTLSNAVELNLT